MKQLSRSPREILHKKAQMSKCEVEMGAGESVDRVMEVGEGDLIVQLKLFYLGVVNNLQSRTGVEREAAVGLKTLEKTSKKMEEQLQLMRGKVASVEIRKKQIEEKLLKIRRETDCLELVGKEREKQHLDVLLSYQAKMKKYTQDISSLQSSAHSNPNTVQQLPLYSKVFPSPPSSHLPFPLSVHPPTSGGLLQFSNLFCLSGQLAQFCQGQHGSKLVMDRLRERTEPERDLVSRIYLGNWQ